MNIQGFAITLLVSWLVPSALLAENLPQSLDEIEQSVRQFVLSEQSTTEGVMVEVRPLDKRLRLPACADALESYWSPGSRSLGRVTVQVGCNSPNPWRVHVQSTVTIEGQVWVIQRGVQRGDILEPDLLVQQTIKLGANNAALTAAGTPVIDLAPWIGYSFSQRVKAGKVLTEKMLKPAKLVSRGETVLIRHESAGLRLQTKGIALKDAAAQQRVQVRNSSSGKIVEAVVVSRGQVEILR